MDKSAVRILFDTYWSPSGWKPDYLRKTAADDFTYAKAMRVMFEPIKLDHAQAIDRLVRAINQLDRQEVAAAFLASLSTKRLDWRSAIGSYAVFQHMKPHSATGDNGRCSTCGFYATDDPIDLNVLNFERLKWGGVRHDHVEYAVLDLEGFLVEPTPVATAADVQLFRDLIEAIHDVPETATSSTLQSYFPKALKSNKAERDVIIAILGLCDILSTEEHPGFSHRFVPCSDRELPDRRFVDMKYPACWWKRSDGINKAGLIEYFGQIL